MQAPERNISTALTPAERRSSKRLPTDRGVQCWKRGERVPVWGKLKDLSSTGCFIQTPTPFPTGAEVNVLLTLYGLKVRAEAQVRFARADGMGVEFVYMADEDVLGLETVIGHLSGPQFASTKMINLSMLSKSDLIVRRLQEWFESHDSLPRSDFERLTKL